MNTTDWVDARQTVGKGTVVNALCQTTGNSITDPVTNISTTLWVKTDYGDGYPWMSAHYFGTTDFASVVEGLPGC